MLSSVFLTPWLLSRTLPSSIHSQALSRTLEPKTSKATPSLSSLFQLGRAVLKSLLSHTCFLLILERMMDYIPTSTLSCYNVCNFFSHCKLMAVWWQDQSFIMNRTLFPSFLDGKKIKNVYNFQDTKKQTFAKTPWWPPDLRHKNP